MAPRLNLVVFFLVLTICLLFLQIMARLRGPFLKGISRTAEPGHLNNSPVQYTSRVNIWADLSEFENIGLLSWLHLEDRVSNLTTVAAANEQDNIILVTELLRPNKSEAMAFIDDRGPPPRRYARLTVRQNSQKPQQIAEYTVGPLPVGKDTRIEPLRFTHNSGRSTTVNPTANIEALLGWIDKVAEQVSDIILDLLGPRVATFRGLAADAFQPSSNDQTFIEGDRVMRWVTFFQKSDASTLLPQALYFKADTTGGDSKQWRVIMWLYNGITYSDIDEFRNAWSQPNFTKLPTNLDGSWTTLEPEPMPDSTEYSTKAPPTMMQPGGSRFTIDADQSFVTWMGFSFNFAFSQITGVSLFDVRLDGERILYELTLQEAMAHYAGNDPIQSSTAFLDSLFGIGSRASELIPGFDCPGYAEFLDLSYFRMEKTYTRRGALCIFEAPTDYPIQRHGRGRAITSFANSVLIMRTIAVVGNYDYLLDYIFYLDGTMEVKVRASGYIQGAYAFNNSEYGYRVHHSLSSSIHDHILNFKVDLDIGGRNNSLSKLSIVPCHTDYNWLAGGPKNTMALERELIDNENRSSLNWPANGASMYVITGPKNIYGENRGYRIMPGTGVGSPVHLTVQNSSSLLRAAHWATHDFFVTRQKDTEPRSAVPANALTPEDPLVDFERFLDGEDLVEEDLVIWFNLGTHHVPHTGDIPNTLMSTSASSIMLAPHNFHTRDRSRTLTDGVRVDILEEGYHYRTTSYGTPGRIGDSFKPSLQGVRKFPSNYSELAI